MWYPLNRENNQARRTPHMPKLITFCLDPEQQKQLEQIRDTDKRPYMRERAAAMLKIAEGISPRQVALNGIHDQT